MRGQLHVPAALYPRKRPGTHCTGGWVGHRAGLDRCEKSRPHRDSIPGPSSLQPVAISSRLAGPLRSNVHCLIFQSSVRNVLRCGMQYVLANGINPLNAELNPICYLLALLAHHFFHVSRIRVKSLTLWLLMSYIYIWSAYS